MTEREIVNIYKIRKTFLILIDIGSNVTIALIIMQIKLQYYTTAKAKEIVCGDA